jgi:murein DD-endopeptidase MepM/ murein hydrolase activator NlpD
MRYGSAVATVVAAFALSQTLGTGVASARPDEPHDHTKSTVTTLVAPKFTPLATMDLPTLQIEAAKLQAEFVRASLELEKARLDLKLSREAVVVAVRKYDAAQREADAEHDRLASYLDLLYTQGPQMSSDLMILLTGLKSRDAMWKQNLVFQEVTSDQTFTVERAVESQDAADRLKAEAGVAQARADIAHDQVKQVLGKISERADAVTAKAEESFTDNEQAALFNDAQTSARNGAAQTAWKAYLAQLRSAHLRPPDAAKLSNPKTLPPGLTALRGRHRKPIPGVALAAHGITVLPRQVVSAVSTSFAALGKPYVAGNAGPETYDCAGLVDAAYPESHLGDTPAEVYEETQRVDPRDTQVGDLVFFANRGAGIHHVGIYLGGDLMLAADGKSSQVGVLAFPERPYAVTRPSLPSPRHPESAPHGDGSTKMSCGVQLLAGGATTAAMVSPVAPGQFHYTAKFGQPGPLWASGFHTGLDFAAPVGTQVVAARPGIVSISHPKWAGNLVTIAHGSGLYTRYAHLSAVFVKAGEQVAGGQTIGAVGQLGNALGPHLHFEVMIAGTTVDPMLFLAGNKGGAGWGGYINGMIPPSVLCHLKSAPNHLLRCDAARAYDALALSFKAEFGQSLCITDSYRSFATQVMTFANKPKLAAVPGTSNHGWGLAVDLCGGIERFGTPQSEWMAKRAEMYGWVHPKWSGEAGGKPEPWHWEFGHIS